MEMVFVGAKALKRRAPYTLAEIVSHEMMTFQRGSQPHLALLEQLRGEGLEPPRLHAVSSIPAMVHLIESGFGIATLPRHRGADAGAPARDRDPAVRDGAGAAAGAGQLPLRPGLVGVDRR